MAKYIDADALTAEQRDVLENDVNVYNSHIEKEIRDKKILYAIECLKDAPAADVELVRHGKWVKTDADFNNMPMELFKCSVCGKETYNLTDTTIPLPKFCDECGTKMDGGSEE